MQDFGFWMGVGALNVDLCEMNWQTSRVEAWDTEWNVFESKWGG